MVSMLAAPVLKQLPALQPIARADLNVTDGSIETSNGRLLVVVPEMRAVVRRLTMANIEVHFTYLGPTKDTSTLRSGEVRYQFGVKLRAQDACNLLYVMWLAAPQPTLTVSMKYNAGMHTSSQCLDGGYRTLTPTMSGRLPSLQPGSAHTLRVDMSHQDIQTLVDGELMWQGRIPSEALSFDGPVGVRSDNVRVAFDVLAAR
jgi:hypothetical protein